MGPKFVIVSWLDAWGEETGEATMANAHEAHKAVPMETLGWLLRQDDKGVSVFCERCTEGKEYVYRGRTFIPTGMITKIEEFKLTKPRKAKQDEKITPHIGAIGGAEGATTKTT